MTVTSPESHPLFELYGTLERAAGIGIWRFNFVGERLTWSGGVYDLLGIPRWSEKPSHDLFSRFMHPQDRLPIDNLARYLKTVRAISREIRIQQRGGGWKWISHVAEVFTNEAGECTFAIGILQDVTALKEAYHARDFAEKELRQLTSLGRTFTWTVDRDGLQLPSQAWTDITGRSAEQNNGLGWLDAIHPQDYERVKAAWFYAVDTRRPYSAKFRLIAHDGELRWFITRCEPIFDSERQLDHWFGVGIDISDVKRPTDPFFSHQEIVRIDGSLFKAARTMLDWSVEVFAKMSGLSVSSIRRLECDDSNSARNTTVAKAMACLESHGIEIRQLDDEGCYVRLRRP